MKTKRQYFNSGFMAALGAGLIAIGLINTMISLAIIGAIFGLFFVPIYNWLALRAQNVGAPTSDAQNKNRQATGLARRTFIKRGFILAGVGIIGVGAWRFITEGISTTTAPVATLVQHFKSKIVPPPVPNYGDIHPAKFLSPEITANDQYYIVSKN